MPRSSWSRTSIGISSQGRRKGSDCWRSFAEGAVGSRSDATPAIPSQGPAWTDRLRLILISALQIDRAVFFSTAIIVAAFIPLFTMQGVEGQIFSPMARTYAYALIGALLATFTVTPCLASLLLPEHRQRRSRRSSCGRCVGSTRRCCAGRCATRKITIAIGVVFLARQSCSLGSRLGSEFLPTLEEGNLWIRATMPPTISLEAGMPYRQPDAGDPAAAIPRSSRSFRSTAGRTTAATRRDSSMPNSSCR